MKTPYRVEMDHIGCMNCKANRTWQVVGPGEVAMATSYDDKDDADALADALNDAFEEGRVAANG